MAPNHDSDRTFFGGDDPLSERLRAHDWTQTSVGEPQQWPQEVRSAVGEVLDVMRSSERGLEANARQQRLLSSAEQALRESEARYQTLFDSVDVGICVFEMIFDEHDNPVDYRWLEINPTFEEQTGLVDAVGKTAREMVPDLDESWFEIYGQVALTGEPVRFENHAPAMERWFDVYAVRVGRPEKRRVALFFNNITERKLADAALRESEHRFREMADTAPAMLWVTGTDNKCSFLSRGWYEYTGQIEGAGQGFGWTEVIHPEDRPASLQGFLEAAEQHARFTLDFRLRGSDGKYRWVIDTGQPRFDAEGNWLGYIGSVIDVDERKRTEQALRKAGQRKDQFMAVLSHELRNPLTPIKLSLELLDHVVPDSSSAESAREVIARQVDQLNDLVDDLLDVTRITRQKVQLQRITLELGELVADTVEDHRSLFASNDIALQFDGHHEPVFVNADPSRLGQVVGNLLHNAAKFTNPGGHVGVSVSVDASSDDAQAHSAQICVTDNGIGMTEETLDDLFEPFIQADTSLDHSAGGLGLGLALVRGLVEQHGGEIEASSAGLGKGAEFVIRLPLTEALPDEATPDEATPPTKIHNSDSRRVLIIEDNTDIACSLATALEIGGHQVEIATNAEEGVDRAERFEPSVVFCDIGLPGADGYTVARQLRSMPKLGESLLVALSGYAMPEDIARSLEAGFDRHIAKPADFSVLKQLLAASPPGL